MGVAASLPEDVLDKAACWLERNDLLCQRAASPSARDAAQRAIAKKANPHVLKISFGFGLGGLGPGSTPKELLEAPQSVVAMGNVFGAGCVELDAAGVSAQSVAALRSFVNATNGGLRKLSLWASGVSSADLVAICQVAPNLVELWGPCYVETSDDAIVAIAAACPRLEQVKFSALGSALGPAERWARFFPRLRTLALTTPSLGPNLYRPTRIDAIAEAARTTSAVELDLEGCYVTADVIEAVVGTPLGDSLTCLSARGMALWTTIEPEALLAAARGFPRLAELWIPKGTLSPDPAWYRDLAQIGSFSRLTLSGHRTTDAHVVAACTYSLVETLEISWIPHGHLTPSFIDGMISSPSAATLRKVEVIYCDGDGISAVDLLRLVQGCPRLKNVWWAHDSPAVRDDPAEDEMGEILWSRGGRWSHDFFGYHDE